MPYPVKICIVGAGNRGSVYAKYAKVNPDQAVVTAVAEPRPEYRMAFAREYNIDEKNVFSDWRELTRHEKIADAAIISTQDNNHVGPALALIEKDYDILLEKPMAPTEEECQEITRAVLDKGVIFGVCHVLRYTKYTQKLKELIDSGLIADIVCMQHLEPVGYWHQAHSYVRGNWRKESESTFMLLAKSCHDLDWMTYIIGSRCVKVSSFGNLVHFKPENKPAGASDRCVDCAVESTCPFSAKKIYLKRALNGDFAWPVEVITHDHTVEGVMKAIEESQYGRCVYACDNDVVDNQVVNMEFETGATAAFVMTGFTEAKTDRQTRIFGTKGEIFGNGSRIEHFDYLTNHREIMEVSKSDGTILTGHGGGDQRIMESFCRAVANQDPSYILSGPMESLETHLSVFKAEQARKENRVITIETAFVAEHALSV